MSKRKRDDLELIRILRENINFDNVPSDEDQEERNRRLLAMIDKEREKEHSVNPAAQSVARIGRFRRSRVIVVATFVFVAIAIGLGTIPLWQRPGGTDGPLHYASTDLQPPVSLEPNEVEQYFTGNFEFGIRLKENSIYFYKAKRTEEPVYLNFFYSYEIESASLVVILTDKFNYEDELFNMCTKNMTVNNINILYDIKVKDKVLYQGLAKFDANGYKYYLEVTYFQRPDQADRFPGFIESLVNGA